MRDENLTARNSNVQNIVLTYSSADLLGDVGFKKSLRKKHVTIPIRRNKTKQMSTCLIHTRDCFVRRLSIDITCFGTNEETSNK